MSVITVEHLHKAYGRQAALRDVSFEVAAGQVVALLGPNGAGKTTTMELLEGYQAPSGGVVRVLGSEPRRAGRAWRARVGLVLQSTSLDLQLTVREALGVYAGLFPRPWPVGELLELVDLAAEADTRIGQLSGGSAAVSTSAWASSAGRSCCSWTSRRPAWTRWRGARPGRRSSA
ncbi:MAG: ATP-binding cassette domain-containing protein [Actinomycetes bacterium]